MRTSPTLDNDVGGIVEPFVVLVLVFFAPSIMEELGSAEIKMDGDLVGGFQEQVLGHDQLETGRREELRPARIVDGTFVQAVATGPDAVELDDDMDCRLVVAFVARRLGAEVAAHVDVGSVPKRESLASELRTAFVSSLASPGSSVGTPRRSARTDLLFPTKSIPGRRMERTVPERADNEIDAWLSSACSADRLEPLAELGGLDKVVATLEKRPVRSDRDRHGDRSHLERTSDLGHLADVDLDLDPMLEFLANLWVWVRHGIHPMAGQSARGREVEQDETVLLLGLCKEAPKLLGKIRDVNASLCFGGGQRWLFHNFGFEVELANRLEKLLSIDQF